MMGLSRGNGCLPGWVLMARWGFSPLAFWVVPRYPSWFPMRLVFAVHMRFVLHLGPECDWCYFRNSSSKTRLLSSALQKAFGCCFSPYATTERCRLLHLLLQMQVAFFGLLFSWRTLWQHNTKILLFRLRYAMDLSFPWREEESMDRRWQMLGIKQGDLPQCSWH